MLLKLDAHHRPHNLMLTEYKLKFILRLISIFVVCGLVCVFQVYLVYLLFTSAPYHGT